MKINKKITLVIISLFLLTGCGKEVESGTKIDSKVDTTKSNGTLICSREANAQNNAQAKFYYEVNYRKGNITKLYTSEKVLTTDDSTLDTYENAYKKISQVFKNLNYYSTKVIRDESSVEYTSTIQYDKVDMEKLKALENSEDSIIKDGKIKVKDWLEFAEQFGTKCEEK